MTTAAKPLPAHGSYARANGSPGRRAACNCPPCRTTRLRVKKRNKVNRQLGRNGVVDATPIRNHLTLLSQTMTWAQIGAHANCDGDHLRNIAVGNVATIRRTTLDKVLATKPAPTAPGKFVDATGTTRRIQALRATGHTPASIAKAFGFSETHVRILSRGDQPTVRQRIAVKVAAAFSELAQTPAPRSSGATMSRNYALAHRWAPPGAWDDIDDPHTHPDWTGHCGTDRGWWAHRLARIPTCSRCDEAHNDWKQERKHLDRGERWAEMGRARATAANREADLADDARELMRVSGLDYGRAAERLQVTRQHLQQALKRHPEPVKEAA